MYKKQEKRFLFLLDKMLLAYDDPVKNHSDIVYLNGEIEDMLQENKGLLPVSIQEKIIQMLPTVHEWSLLKALSDKAYQHWSGEVVKLLDLKNPSFSRDVIETLYKMGTYQYVEEIRPFAVVNMDDKIPHSQHTYREGLGIYDRYYAKYPPGADSTLESVNNVAKKYIKRAEKLKAKYGK